PAPPIVHQPGEHSFSPEIIEKGFVSPPVQVGTILWAVEVVEKPYEVGTMSVDQAAVRWYKFDVSAGTLLQSGDIDADGYDYFSPSISANSRGDVLIAYQRSGGTWTSGTTGLVGSYATVGTTSGGTTTLGNGYDLVLRAGTGTFTSIVQGVRLGDYSNTSRDPCDPQVFWTIQQVA